MAMDYPSVRFLSHLRQPNNQDTTDIAQESVDLLQMVPESGRVHRCPEETLRASGHETTPRRMRVLLVQDEQERANEEVTELRGSREAVDAPDANIAHAHICQNCSRDGSLYYNRQGELGHYDCRHVHNPDTTRDGSVYFNYLQFANRSRTGTLQNPGIISSGSTYEPIDRGGGGVPREGRVPEAATKKLKPPKPPKPLKATTVNHGKDRSPSHCKNFVFNCCKSNNLSASQQGKGKGKANKDIEEGLYGASPYHHHRSGSPVSSPAILNNNRARKTGEWSRVKRLLFLVGILLGILVALGGIVVGFVVLAPYRNKAAPSCGRPTAVYCDGVGCVHTSAICQGLITCRNVITANLCPANATKEVSPVVGHQEVSEEKIDVVTYVPNFEQPIKDDKGWVYFSQGSGPNSGSRYTIVNKAMMFSAAQRECRSRGGHLPYVNSLREQIFLEDFISQELLDSDIRRDAIGFWLGARRARGSHSGTCLYKQWRWVDVYGRNHGVINGFTAFGIDKPDNYFNPEECLYLSYSDKSPENFLKWDDAPCDIPTIGSIKVICEIDDR